MTYSRIATMAALLAAGMIGVAQAQTSPTTTPSAGMGGTAPAVNSPSTSSSASDAMNPGQGGEATASEIKQAQQQLKSQGLYNGPIDGVLGPDTKTALSKFQQSNGLPQTASLDQATRARLMNGEGGATSGVGSTTAPSSSSSSMSGPSAGSTTSSPPASSTTAPMGSTSTKHY